MPVLVVRCADVHQLSTKRSKQSMDTDILLYKIQNIESLHRMARAVNRLSSSKCFQLQDLDLAEGYTSHCITHG